MKLAKRLMMLQSGGETDPYWANVSLCINAEGGTQDGTNIVDAKGKTIGVYGDARYSNEYDGIMSITFDGSGDYLTVPASADFNFGSGDFTIDMRIRLAVSQTSSSRLWNPNGDYVDGVDITLSRNSSEAPIGVYMSSNGSSWDVLSTLSNYRTLVPGVWTYLAVKRSGGSVYLGVNGTEYLLSNSIGTTSLYYRNTGHSIGGQAGTDRPLYGNIANYRITKGVARNISVIPTFPFPTS